MRMLVALGVADYARGSYDEAAHCLANASDIDPRDPTPYLFLGSMQDAEIIPSEGTVDRLARFVELQPENPLASYYYAVGLLKESGKEAGKESLSPAGGEHDEQPRVQPENGDARSLFVRVESLLQKALKLDPKLGAAYLQLGKLYSQRGDLSRAISAYETAIAVISEQARPLPLGTRVAHSQSSHPEILYPEIIHPQIEEALEESHYRLAQAYLRTGEKAKAQEQLQLHQELSKKTKEDSDRERRDIQEFVISLRNNNPPAQ
jgi:tetratricopeptide (TPR) repeat protein